jgi:hypothetical protein
VDEMVDMHLINIAVAGLGISAAVAIAIAAAIIGISAIVLHGREQHGRMPQGAKLSLTEAPAAECIPVTAGGRQAA